MTRQPGNADARHAAPGLHGRALAPAARGGDGLLAEAVAAGIRPRVTTFALEDAGEALVRRVTDAIDGSAVLVP